MSTVATEISPKTGKPVGRPRGNTANKAQRRKDVHGKHVAREVSQRERALRTEVSLTRLMRDVERGLQHFWSRPWREAAFSKPQGEGIAS